MGIQRQGRIPFNGTDANHVTFLGLNVLHTLTYPSWSTKEDGQLPHFAASSHRSDRSIIVYQHRVPICELFGHRVISAPAPDGFAFHPAVSHKS